jgi:hypothetical protein
MGIFANFSRKKKQTESVVLIDIGTDSIASAYARYVENETPVLLYTRRLPIEVRENEPHERAMLRALETLGNTLIREGAPVLMRATGSGSADAILVSIDASGEETNVRTEHLEREHSFTFTTSLVSTVLKNTADTPSGKIIANESIIGTILNGYETTEPYGKEMRRADITILTSFIDKNISGSLISTLRGLFHTEHISLIAGKSLRYQAMRVAFQYEHKPSDSFLEQALDAADSGKLWLPGNPPKIIPVHTSHLAGLVRQVTPTPPDLQLLLVALYHQSHSFKG